MFKVGQTYEFGMWEHGESGEGSVVVWHNCEVAEVKLPLVKISHGPRDADKTVINTHSPAFAWARVQKKPN